VYGWISLSKNFPSGSDSGNEGFFTHSHASRRVKCIRHEKSRRNITLTDIFSESCGNRIVMVCLHRNLVSTASAKCTVRIQKFPGRAKTISSKPEHVYQARTNRKLPAGRAA